MSVSEGTSRLARVACTWWHQHPAHQPGTCPSPTLQLSRYIADQLEFSRRPEGQGRLAKLQRGSSMLRFIYKPNSDAPGSLSSRGVVISSNIRN